MSDLMSWPRLDELARELMHKWGGWETDAGAAAQCEQDTEAGSAVMQQHVAGFLCDAFNEAVRAKVEGVEKQAASHGAIQARREVCAYLRRIGQPLVAMAIEERCKWPE